jgi:signal transduction histidine kinase
VSADPARGHTGQVTDHVQDHPLADSAKPLLDAVIAISSDLDLNSVLTRIIGSATELTGARFGALGIIGGDGELSDFITTGIDPDTREQIGDLPRGRGILRLLIDEPETIRLDDLGAHPRSFGFPPNHPTMITFLGVPVRIRGTVFGNLYLTEKDSGLPFTESDELLVQALASAAGFVIENARAFGLSERRRQWLEASSELADTLQPPVDLDRALQLITNSARAIAGAETTAVVQVPESGAASVVALDGPSAESVRGLLQSITTASQRGRWTAPIELAADDLKAIVIPLRAHLAAPGVLVALFDKSHRAGEYEERELLMSFADQAALALDRAQALKDREELAVISDRDRIARDLHDLVIQRLFATGLQLQGVRSASDTPALTQRIDETVDALDLTIRDIRSTIFELQDRQTSSLRAETRKLVKEYVPVLGFAPTVRTLGPVDTAVPEPIRDQLLAVLREAISNLARHALADHAEVELRVDTHEVVLTVTDDGVGLRADRHESGLRNARRRASSLGGSLEVFAGDPQGTTFVWRAPLS